MAKNCTYTIDGQVLSESELKNYLLSNFNQLKGDIGFITNEEEIVEPAPHVEDKAPSPADTTVKEMKPTNKKELATALTNIFNLPKEQVTAITAVVDAAATGMINLGIYGSKEEYYQNLPMITNAKADSYALYQTAMLTSFMERQKDNVRKESIANGTFMKSVNGNDTGLTEDTWLAINTPQMQSLRGQNNTRSILSPTTDGEFIRYDFMKDGKKVGSYEIEQLSYTTAKISFFKSDIQGFGYGEDIFNEATVAIQKMGLSPVIDNYVTGYGYRAMEKMAEKGILTKIADQMNPTARMSMQQEYATPPFAYNENYKEGIYNQENKAAIDTRQRIMYALTDPDASSPLHEFSHLWLADIMQAAENGNEQAIALYQRVTDFALSDEGKRFFAKYYTEEEYSLDHPKFVQELFARGFERYIAEGQAPNSKLKELFIKFREWLIDIYNGIVGSPIDITLSPQMEATYEQLLGKKLTKLREKELNQERVKKENAESVASLAEAGVDILSTKDLKVYVEDLANKITNGQLDVNDAELYQNVVDARSQLQFYIDRKEKEDTAFRKEQTKGMKAQERADFLDTNPEILARDEELDTLNDQSYSLDDFIAEAKKIHGSLAEKEEVKPTNQDVYLTREEIEQRRQATEKLLAEREAEKRSAPIAPVSRMTISVNTSSTSIKDEKMGRDRVLLEPEVAGDNFKGFSVGDRVEYDGKKYFIKGINKNSANEQGIEDNKIGTRAYLIEEKNIDIRNGRPYINKNTQAKIVPVLISEGGLEKLEIPQEGIEETEERELEPVEVTANIIARFQQMFPSIKFEMGRYEWTQYGKFENGKVMINLNALRADTPVHEVMHPFVRAIGLSSPTLYRNLLNDLNTRASEDEYIQEMRDDIENDSTYEDNTSREKTEELLVRVLTNDIMEVFNTDGTVNAEVLEQKSKSFKDYLVEFFNMLMDLIKGKKVNYDFSDFLNKMNTNPTLKDKYVFKEDFDKESGRLGAAPQAVKLGNKTVIVVSRDYYTNTTTAQNLFHSLAEDLSEEDYNELVSEASNTISKSQNRQADFQQLYVQDLPVNMTIEELSVFMLDNNIQVQFKESEQRAINEMEAYSSSSKADTIKKLKDRLRNLRDTGSRRIIDRSGKASSLVNEAAYQEQILRDQNEDEALLNYIRTAHVSLKNAVYRMNMMRTEITDAKKKNGGELKVEDILKFNGEFREIMTLHAFYSDLESLIGMHNDVFSKTQSKTAAKNEIRDTQITIGDAERQKKQFKGILVDLAVDLIFPQYLEKMQLTLQRNPNSKYISIPTINNGTQLDVEKLKQDLKNSFYTSTEDATLPSYLLGAAINSKDPVTAMITLTMNDALYQNNVAEDALIELTRHEYFKFLSDKGVANNEKDQREWFKQNYMRKARIWEKTGERDETTGLPKWAIVERYAYHEDKFYDEIGLAVRAFTEAQPKATTAQEYIDLRNKIVAYEKQLNADPKFINPEYAKLSVDPFYNHLYNNYKNLNRAFGVNKLKYGIIPQIRSQATLTKDIKNIRDGFTTAKDRVMAEKTAKGKVGVALTDAANKLFSKKEQFDNEELNFDNTIFRNIRTSSLNPINEEEDLELLLHENLILFAKDSFHYSAFRELQPAIENMRLLINGNVTLGIQPRETLQTNTNGKDLKWYQNIKLPKRKSQDANRLRKQLNAQIDDVMYGMPEKEYNIAIGNVNINLNKIGDKLGLFTALSGMTGNLFAATRNITTGNVLNFGEAISARYYNKTHYRQAVSEYFSQTFSPKTGLMSDLYGKEKSKLSQLALIYDAIQGEYRSNRKLITGGITRSLYDRSNFFILSRMGEHQIQLTHMIALMKATKVKTTSGETIDLYSAYTVDKNGVFNLRKDVEWTDSDNKNFRDLLHSTGRELNGNYSPNHKAVLQRNILGKQLMIFKKYLYYQTRARWGGAKINYERGDIDYGYYRMFLKEALGFFRGEGLRAITILYNKDQQEQDPQLAAAARKTVYEMALMIGLVALVKGITPDDDDDEMSKSAMYASILLNGVYGDVGNFSVNAPSEAVRLIKTPAASENNLIKLGSFGSQMITDMMGGEMEVYDKNGNGVTKGETKLGHKLEKLIPLYNKIETTFEHPEQYLNYQTLTGRKVKTHKNNTTE